MWGGAVERAIKKTLCTTKDELKAKITAAFTNLNKETVRKACRWFQSHLEAMVEGTPPGFLAGPSGIRAGWVLETKSRLGAE